MGRVPARQLSEQNKDVLQAIIDLRDQQGRAPTYTEIAAWVGLKSTNSIAQHVKILKRLGFVEHGPHRDLLVLKRPNGRPISGNKKTGAVPAAA